MLKCKITNNNVISTLNEIKYELVNDDNGYYTVQTIPFEVDYKLVNDEEIIIQGRQVDNTLFTTRKRIIIDNTLEKKQFKITKFDNVKLNLFSIINNDPDIVFTFYDKCYLNVGDEIHVQMDVSYKTLSGDSTNLFDIPVNISKLIGDNAVIVQFKDTYNGLSKDFIINLFIKPENITYFTVYKLNNNFFRDDNNIKPSFFKPKYDYVIPVKLNSDFSTDMFQTEQVMTKFVDIETEKAIKPIVNMEKNVYTPAYIPLNHNQSQLRGQGLPVIEEIEFNLHFRERDTTPENKDKWLVKQNGYWNGYQLEGTRLSPIERVVTFDSPDEQSDLLGYLNFSDGDVRFQKSKLKQSFIRLLFYDSRDSANQRLLCYSTIFIDSGVLFTRYAKYNENGTYVIPTSGNTFRNSTGITVDGEYIEGNNDITREEHRLDSRFIVKDKYNSTASSEGFYLYLFNDNNSKLRPKDIYMRVEFNHAGYGRTVPFMLPMKLDDNGYPEPISVTEQLFPYNGYKLSDYYYNLYIPLKYVYDDVNKRYVYYLQRPFDPSLDDNLTKMVFNLYEVKVD